jgi:hypothetical protein
MSQIPPHFVVRNWFRPFCRKVARILTRDSPFPRDVSEERPLISLFFFLLPSAHPLTPSVASPQHPLEFMCEINFTHDSFPYDPRGFLPSLPDFLTHTGFRFFSLFLFRRMSVTLNVPVAYGQRGLCPFFSLRTVYRFCAIRPTFRTVLHPICSKSVLSRAAGHRCI